MMALALGLTGHSGPRPGSLIGHAPCPRSRRADARGATAAAAATPSRSPKQQAMLQPALCDTVRWRNSQGPARHLSGRETQLHAVRLSSISTHADRSRFMERPELTQVTPLPSLTT